MKANYKSDYSSLYLSRKEVGKVYNERISNKFELQIFELEKFFLKKIINEFSLSNASYLDFACGTGRIIGYLSQLFSFKEQTGLDLSPNMINGARKTYPNVNFVVGNILEKDQVLDNHYDFITAFRLVLNLEEKNRKILLRAISKKLKKGGIFIVNNHMNRHSLMGLIAFTLRKLFKFAPKNDLEAKKKGKRTIINTMSSSEMNVLLKESGFEIKKVYRFALLPGYKKFICLPKSVLYYLELFLSNVPLLNLLSKDQIYVCVKK